MNGQVQFDWDRARARIAALGEALAGRSLSSDDLARRLNERAEVLAQRGAVAARDISASHVVVRAGSERCAIRLAEVAGAVRIISLARLPGTPAEMSGVIREKGLVWPVLELARLLGLTPQVEAASFAVLLRRRDRRVALGVAGFEAMRETVPSAPRTGGSQYVRAVAGDLILIDAEAVLDHPLLGKESHT